MSTYLTRVSNEHAKVKFARLPREKKSRNPLEFRLARDKDQLEEIVSNISDDDYKSQENFLAIFVASSSCFYHIPPASSSTAFDF